MTASSEAFDELAQRKMLAVVARAQRDGRLPSLSTAIGDNHGRILWSGGRGRVDGRRPTENVQYRIGSITKTFTAMLILALRDRGELRLSDDVDRWLPNARALAGRTIAELLYHTGGIRAETSPPWWERSPGRTWTQVMADLDESGARQYLRGRHHYSNIGYAALGQVVARIMSVTWFDTLSKLILEPLGLRRTTYSPVDPAANGWAVHPWANTLIREPTYDTGAMAPAGQLWSTTADLVVWGQFLLGDGGDVVASATLDEMMDAAVLTGRSPWVKYGLGIAVATDEGQTLVGHGGTMPGFMAQLTVDRGQGLTAVALANATTGLPDALPTELLGIASSYRPPIVDEWHPSDAPSPVISALLGVWYQGPRPYVVATTATRGVLSLRAVEAGGRDTLLDMRQQRWMARGGYFDGEPLCVPATDQLGITHFELASFVFTREPYGPSDAVPGNGNEQH